MAASDRMIPLRGSQAVCRSNDDNFTCFLDLDRDAWCFRDLNGRFTYINSSFLSITGANDATQFINNTLDTMETLSSSHKENLLQIERKVINTKSAIVIPIWGLPFYGYKNPVLNIKISPFLSNNGAAVSGVYWHCFVHHFIPLRKITNYGLDADIKSSSPYDFFSARDWAVIWLFFIGWSHKEISFYLNINEKSSKQSLSRSYRKIGVTCFSELHRIIVSNSWDAEVPVF